MTNSKSSDKPELLRLISGMGSYGVAESEPKDQFLKRFLPLKEHARALESNVILVVGDRGAGKTELFRAIQFPAGLRAISELSGNRLIPPQDRTDWMIGYASSESSFPPELVFRGFAKSKSPTDLQFIWLGLLLRSLQNQLPLLSPELKTATLSNDLVRMYATVEAHLVDVFSMLDSLDRELVNSDRWIIIPYDELDRVSAGDWGALAVILRGLVQFWSSYARRWERIRPKIFIRRDLFERVAIVGPDVSKIAAQRVELVWTPRLL
ncbi:MAG: hypothetical protein NT069_22445, partial [Planctomycetota bacterium]|nr:hypothetical protein [Planctomycetota bacterium]